jgi:hypothetical protein
MMTAVSASSQHNYMHIINDGFIKQSYESVMSSDGYVIIDEDIFDYDGRDIGIRFLKVGQESGLVDSLFVEDVAITSRNILARNPLVGDGNVYLYFSYDNVDSVNYYNAIFFNDDMSVTDRFSLPVPIAEEMQKMRYYMEPGGDFLVSWRDATLDTCRIARFGLDGTLKKVSEPVYMSNGTLPTNNPWFMIEDEPMRMGYLNYAYADNGNYTGEITVLVFDSELNFEEPRTITHVGLNNWCRADSHTAAISMGNGNFAIMVGSPGGGMLLGKYNSDFELLANHVVLDTNPYGYVTSTPLAVDIIDGGLYVVVYSFEQTYTDMEARVRYLNSDMEMVWERVIAKGSGITVRASLPFETGGAVLSGYLAFPDQCYLDSYAFVSFIYPDYNSLENIQRADVPIVCYPNPAKNTVNIAFSDDIACQSVEIYAIDGRLLHSQISNFVTVDMSSLESGIYIIKVRLADGGEYSGRVVKE